MSILSAMQSASIRLVGSRPTAFFGGVDQFAMEISNLVNEVATDIARSSDWQALASTYEVFGDGAMETFPLPTDYDRMPADAEMFDPNNWAWNYLHIASQSEFDRWKAQNWNIITPGAWTIARNALKFWPAPPVGASARFSYISRNYAVSASAVAKPAFDSDDDESRLDERLITLALVWRWREMKRLDTTGDQESFAKAFDELSGKDAGPSVIRSSSRRLPRNISSAWPWELG